jgi:hypothetical protein
MISLDPSNPLLSAAKEYALIAIVLNALGGFFWLLTVNCKRNDFQNHIFKSESSKMLANLFLLSGALMGLALIALRADTTDYKGIRLCSHDPTEAEYCASNCGFGKGAIFGIVASIFWLIASFLTIVAIPRKKGNQIGNQGSQEADIEA